MSGPAKSGKKTNVQSHSSLKKEKKPLTKLEKSLNFMESKIRNKNQEEAYLVSPQGNKIFYKKGGNSSVKFSLFDMINMKGNILTHNHPNGSSFSPDDIHTLGHNRLKEIRIASKWYNYSLSVIPSHANKLQQMESSHIDKLYKQLKSSVKSKYDNYKTQGITKEESYRRMTHEVLTKLANNLGLKYTRTKNS